MPCLWQNSLRESARNPRSDLILSPELSIRKAHQKKQKLKAKNHYNES
jgi:hypothetical protein